MTSGLRRTDLVHHDLPTKGRLNFPESLAPPPLSSPSSLHGPSDKLQRARTTSEVDPNFDISNPSPTYPFTPHSTYPHTAVSSNSSYQHGYSSNSDAARPSRASYSTEAVDDQRSPAAPQARSHKLHSNAGCHASVRRDNGPGQGVDYRTGGDRR